MTESARTPRIRLGNAGSAFAGALGLFVALGLLKFGNPVVLDHKLTPPSNLSEFLVWSWPANWAYPMLVLLVGWGILLRMRLGAAPSLEAKPSSSQRIARWLAWLPLAWLFWQALSAIWSVNAALTLPTLKHFAAATACFYLGFLVVSRLDDMRPFWLGVLGGVIGVLTVGLDQHFGGLEASRRYIYSQPDWQSQSPALLKKIASNRIYGTLFYPNSLAGAILLLLPPLVAVTLAVRFMPGQPIAQNVPQDQNPIRVPRLSGSSGLVGRVWFLLGGLATLGGLACLYWSGSKAGWLIALVPLTLVTFSLPWSARLKWAIALCLMVVGVAAFLLRYQGYFEKGASSVGARMDYWAAAVKIVAKRPLLGSGPGTFSVLYRYLKSPESEMARLVHNDYLEQASDSGLPGALIFLGLWAGGLWICHPFARKRCAKDSIAGHGSSNGYEAKALEATASKNVGSAIGIVAGGWVTFGIWLGLLGLALQSLVEFGLYLPATAFPAFLLLGMLLGQRANGIDSC